jgi:hypothetical protein
MLQKRWLATFVALAVLVAGWIVGAQLAAAAEGEVTRAASGELSLGSGVQFTTGDYGGPSSTQILTIPFNARYDNGPWTFKAIVPYLHMSGPRAVVPGVGRVESGGPISDLLGLPVTQRQQAAQSDRRTVSGLGDSSVSASYLFSGAGKRSGVGLSARIKFATGDETQGLGTGSNDLSAQIDAFQQLEGNNSLFGVLGYTWFGDSPIVQFQNVANIGVGFSHRTATGDSVGVAFDARQGASPAPAAQRELTGFWSHRVDRNWRTQLYALRGFANGSPDWGGGLSLGYAF